MPKNMADLSSLFGGGAVFFAVHPTGGIIADSNPELVNLYRSVATDVEGVMAQLRGYENTEEVFYSARALDVTKLSNVEAAARTIFLNRTCFNGLYRVNKSGQFNVPFGRYKNPKIIDEDALKAASALLSNTTIICGDYKTVLKENAQTGDFIFLTRLICLFLSMPTSNATPKSSFTKRIMSSWPQRLNACMSWAVM